MRLLFIADGRSPIALNWIGYFVQAGHEVHLASTYACDALPGAASLTVLPMPLGGVVEAAGAPRVANWRGRVLRLLAPPDMRTRVRQWVIPFGLGRPASVLRQLEQRIRPDLVQAMRIPYEGMVAARSGLHAPLLLSIWGNDFTLHAPSTPWMSRLTRQALQAAAALHTDCQNDARLAREWGFSTERPILVAPGAGGVQRDVFYPHPPVSPPERGGTKGGVGVRVIQPRGMRAYVRNDTVFAALRILQERLPGVRYVFPAMAGERQAEAWAAGLETQVTLLPKLSRAEIAEAFRSAQVALSITTHDGTPNTLLEAMACGCFPIAGDIPSLREWIEDGVNGLLVNPGDPAVLAHAIERAVQDDELRQQALGINQHLIDARADYARVMPQAAQWMQALINHRGDEQN